jgi:hypothetical protein
MKSKLSQESWSEQWSVWLNGISTLTQAASITSHSTQWNQWLLSHFDSESHSVQATPLMMPKTKQVSHSCMEHDTDNIHLLKGKLLPGWNHTDPAMFYCLQPMYFFFFGQGFKLGGWTAVLFAGHIWRSKISTWKAVVICFVNGSDGSDHATVKTKPKWLRKYIQFILASLSCLEKLWKGDNGIIYSNKVNHLLFLVLLSTLFFDSVFDHQPK